MQMLLLTLALGASQAELADLPSIRPLREALTAPLYDIDATGVHWARTRDLRVAFDGQALTVYPVLGRSAPRELPVRFELTAARAGGEALALAPGGAPVRAGDSVHIARGAVCEVHHLTLAGVEQTFRLEQAPPGELVLEVAVTGDLEPRTDGARLTFVDEGHGFGHLDYGTATLIDADGRAAPIERCWTGTAIELRVPADLLAGAAWPVTVDPLIQWFSNGFGANDDARPDAVYCGVTNEYLVCWEEYTSAANSDVYLTKWDVATATQGPSIGLEMGNDHWVRPRIAYAYAADRVLVVASVNPEPLGLPNSAVQGRLVDVGAFAAVGSALTISSIGAPKRGADVGGSNRVALAENRFCVVWSHDAGPGDRDIQYRVLEPSGAFLTGVVTVDGSPEDDVQPAIARHLGGGNAADLFWNLVWIRDTDEDGVGRVLGRKVARNGEFNLGGGTFTVDGAGNASRPSVTARLDQTDPATGDRPAVVAYERHFNGDRDIRARVISATTSYLPALVTAMEGFDRTLDQRDPAIATTGRGFVVAYTEDDWSAPGTGNLDVYCATGNVIQENGQLTLALGERHLAAATTTLPEGPPRVALREEGDPFEVTPEGVLVWSRQGPTQSNGFGGVHGVRFMQDAATVAGPKPVGRQFCEALPNSVPFFGGRNTAWLRILGNQSTGTVHTAQCSALPNNAFAYLLASRAFGSTDFPGGSSGRLCLSGSVGRFVDQVVSSGGTGTVSVSVNPLALPQPTGAVAALPGETWYFQLWHRDAVGGVTTSNFSNGCAVYFRN